MGSNYVSPAEQEYRDERKARAIMLDGEIKEKNSRLVGMVNTYKGIEYQLRQDGIYTCINLPKGSPLDGLFTSDKVLKKTIDDLTIKA